jgi:hypothetical protein
VERKTIEKIIAIRFLLLENWRTDSSGLPDGLISNQKNQFG